MRSRAVLIALLVMLGGCATAPPVRYYALDSGAPPPAGAAVDSFAPWVAIGPVTVPEALDRSQIVLRLAANRLLIADTDQWSEPLKRAIPRVIADVVGRELRSAHVATFAQDGGRDADYRVPIDVLRLEAVAGDSITLEAAWSVRSRAGVRLHEARSVMVEPVQAAGIAPVVAAHEKALIALGREIAAAVDALARSKPPSKQ